MASRCVQVLGTTWTSAYPPPPVEIQRPSHSAGASSCTISCACRCPSTLSARCASGSSRWLSHPCWLTSTVGLKARSSGSTTASTARRLHAVTVVHVEVHVGHPLRPGGKQPLDRDGEVVVHAEPARVRPHRVV